MPQVHTEEDHGLSVLKAAVVGVGTMGYHHTRVLSRMEGVDLVGVVDADPARAAEVADHFGVRAIGALAELPDVDFAIVATPTHAHLETALELVARGASILVEKPLAQSSVEARNIVDAAASAGVVLGVGHIERFNPAVRLLAEIVDAPLLMQFERLSPYTPRIRESVVFDLMVHDLDLACMLAGEMPVSVSAEGVLAFSSSSDAASAILRFPSGCVASLQSSRITQDKVRRISVSEAERFIFADCLRQDVSVKRETQVSYTDEAAYRQVSAVEVPYVDRRTEPLVSELEGFIAAVRREVPPPVSGADGLAAVSLAEDVEAAIGAEG